MEAASRAGVVCGLRVVVSPPGGGGFVSTLGWMREAAALCTAQASAAAPTDPSSPDQRPHRPPRGCPQGVALAARIPTWLVHVTPLYAGVVAKPERPNLD